MGKLDEVFTTGLLAAAVPPRSKEKEIYGPGWQRTVMAHIRNKGRCWAHNNTVPTAYRPSRLEELMEHLGITDVVLGNPINVIPLNVDKTMAELRVGQRVQIDKPGHSMGGLVFEVSVDKVPTKPAKFRKLKKRRSTRKGGRSDNGQ